MNGRFKDAEHYVRAAILFAIGLFLFLIIRGVMVPKDFGRLGHFRPGALDDNRAHAMMFAGRALCEECHEDVVASRAGSRHDRVNCEACHGALAAHAEDPTGVKPTLPDGRQICLSCHEMNAARPAGFPQVEPQEHAGDEVCTTCHMPHRPEIE